MGGVALSLLVDGLRSDHIRSSTGVMLVWRVAGRLKLLASGLVSRLSVFAGWGESRDGRRILWNMSGLFGSFNSVANRGLVAETEGVEGRLKAAELYGKGMRKHGWVSGSFGARGEYRTAWAC